jgi:UDP-glucose 4-epimerase
MRMNSLILGAAGFLGTNLTILLSAKENERITVFDREEANFSRFNQANRHKIQVKTGIFSNEYDFNSLTQNIDIVYHLISTTNPTRSNKNMAEDLNSNVAPTIKLLQSCVTNNVRKVIFISSGGTVYGKGNNAPHKETDPTYPISSYGIEKLTIEKYLYLFHHQYGLNYCVARIANPYGPMQVPNSGQGAVTTFCYKALHNQPIVIYGDGSVVRDYIYVDDAIEAVYNIAQYNGAAKIFNIGSGFGTSLKDIIDLIENILGKKIPIQYEKSRKVDVPCSVLNITRYQNLFGPLQKHELSDGIQLLFNYFRMIEKCLA